MIDELITIYEQIKHFKENLTKLAKPKRTPRLLSQKHLESCQLYEQYLKYSEYLDNKISKNEIKSKDILIIKETSIRIESLYSKIHDFCNSSFEGQTMEKFNLKTAVSLLPMMNGDERVTESLIDAIQLYDSMIERSGEQQLINFVLKTRLSKSAKLRMAQTYNTCESLISDMKLNLLTKQSSVAILSDLNRVKQNSMSLEQYGQHLEDLFTNLTLAQAGDDSNAHTVLRPQNEKIAIRRFIDGLRNPNLRIILAARNYTALNDVIRAAKDEELTAPSTSHEDAVYAGYVQENPGTSYIRRGRGTNFSRGNLHGRNSQSFGNTSRNWYNQTRYTNRGQQNRGNYSNRAQARGKSNFTYRNNRDHQDNNNINSMSFNHNNESENAEQNQSEPIEFFRA